MPDAKPVQKGNSYEVKKKEKQKKKEKVQLKLPNTRHLIKRQRAVAQGKANYNDLYAFVGVVFLIGLILFVLLGGINQRKFIETVYRISQRWGETISQWFNPDSIVVNNDGIYLDPEVIINGTEEPEIPGEGD